MAGLPRIVLKPRRARPFFARHPWVFVTSIERVEGDPRPAAEVDVYSHEDKFIGRGIFNPKSSIRVRLFRWEDAPLDEAFWSRMIASAVRLRADTVNLAGHNRGYRVVSSEADGLSGLTVDRYDRWLVAPLTSLAAFDRREQIGAALMAATGAEGLLLRTERVTAEQEGIPHPFESVVGTLPNEPIEIIEHGIIYWIDPRAGQKTGFFLDQRDNRLAAASYCDVRGVLDLFFNRGGFPLNANKNGRAATVLGVDSSATIVEVARHHAEINKIADVMFEAGDALAVLSRLRAENQLFGVVILDPPKFARNSARRRRRHQDVPSTQPCRPRRPRAGRRARDVLLFGLDRPGTLRRCPRAGRRALWPHDSDS